MRLLEEFRRLLATEESLFRAQLLREDIAKFEKLIALAHEHTDYADFEKNGFYLEWTQSDFRTHELRDTLQRFLEAFYRHVREHQSDRSDDALQEAWESFDRDRMNKLIGCL